MQFFQVTTLLAAAATVSAVAIPGIDNWKTSSSPEACATTTTSTAWGGKTATPTSTWGGDKPTTTPWADKPTTTATPTTVWGVSEPWGTSTIPAQPTGTTIPACENNGDISFIPVSQCSANGGSPYQCSTIGLLNLLNCISLLNGNTISIPISVSIL